MKLAPTPAKAASLTRTQITAALKRAGRKRGIEADVERLREAFRTDWARQPELVEDCAPESSRWASAGASRVSRA